LYSTFMLFFALGSLIGTLFVPIIGKKLKNKATLPKFAYIFGGILMIIIFFVDPKTNWTLLIILNFLAVILTIGSSAMMYAMIPDCTEYAEHKTGIRAAGFISAFITFLLKVGMAIGTSGIGFVLAAMGYHAGAVQTPSVLFGINLFNNLIPGILAIIGGSLFFAYKLDKDTYYKMLDEIKTVKA
ncbi:MFS transporter, partial [Neobacillus drentensis]|uniref:MFS transporter n=1 Tax=Neobacillus drentensis TaxID=220684 RepID=UPI002FFD7953